jgi:thiamine biosynthesis lipoprotein
MNRVIVLALLALLPGACGRQHTPMPQYELIGQTMGTSFSIKVVTDDELNGSQLEQEVAGLLSHIDSNLSTWQPDSDLSLFNSNTSTDWIEVTTELCDVIEAALNLSERTGGAFDITVGPLVNLWGFGPKTREVETVPTDESIASARKRVGYQNLQTDCLTPAIRKSRPDVYVDLSAFAKGYAVDQLAELLDKQGIENYLVELGGELRLRGHNANSQSWAVAIEKPADFERTVQTVVHLTDQAMATSGDYRNFFEIDDQRYSHTIDSRTGRPVAHNAAAVTVISASAASADGLATALLVLGPEEGFEFAERENIAAYFLIRRGSNIEEIASTAFTVLPQQ